MIRVGCTNFDKRWSPPDS